MLLVVIEDHENSPIWRFSDAVLCAQLDWRFTAPERAGVMTGKTRLGSRIVGVLEVNPLTNLDDLSVIFEGMKDLSPTLEMDTLWVS